MRAICKSLVLVALVAVLVVVLTVSSDESDADDLVRYPNEVNFNPDEVNVFLDGNEIEPRTVINISNIITIEAKTGYQGVRINGEEFVDGFLIVFSDHKASGLVITAEKKSYSITFNTDNTQGSSPDPLYNVKIGDTINLPLPTITKVGYDMVGWNTGNNGSGSSLSFGSTVVNTEFITTVFSNGEEKTLYPIWTVKTYQISLTTERGEILDEQWNRDKTTYNHDYTIESEDIALPSAESDDRFHYFVCWEDENGNTISSISSGTSGNISLSAVWALKEYSMSFNVNGKTVTQTCTLDTTLDDPECEEGFRFVGWFYKDQDGNETEFTSMSQMYENMSVYAVFEPTKTIRTR